MVADTATSSEASGSPIQAPKLLDRMRTHLRTRHYSIRTEQVYLDWERSFILYHNKRHPQEMARPTWKHF